MSERCPFCHRPVSESIVQLGGTCPSCFADIPGEDAATDPGEIVRAQRRAKDEADVRKQSMKQAWVFAPVALIVLGVGAFALMPEPEVTELVIEDFAIDFDMKEWDPKAGTKARGAGALPSKAGEGTPVAPSAAQGASTGANLTASAAGGLAMKGASAAGTPPTAPPEANPISAPSTLQAPSMAASGSGSGLALGEMPEVTAERSGPMISASKKEEVVAVVRSMMSRRKEDIAGCITPGLSGSWTLKITFDVKGDAKAVDLAPLGPPAPEFESCVEANVKRWKLGAQLDREITVPVPLNLRG